MTKKYVKTETLTITRTEEVSFLNGKETEKNISEKQLVNGLWQLIKKYLFLFKWIGGEDDG